jgi:hypothetical protein
MGRDLVSGRGYRKPGGAECNYALAGGLAGPLVHDEQVQRVAVVGHLPLAT